MAWTLKLLFVATLLVGCLASTENPSATGTTENPSATGTTENPSATGTTENPSATGTTENPSATGTTENPSATSTTQSPSINGTTENPSATSTTQSPSINGTTQSPATTPVPATTEGPDACHSEPCKGGSTCEPRFNQTYECLCLLGDYYEETTETCSTGKVFPGMLTDPSITYKATLANKKSSDFLENSQLIVGKMRTVFNKTKGYKDSTVLEFRQTSTRAGGVIALIDIMFSATSDVKDGDIKDDIEVAKEDGGVLEGSTFEASKLCDEKRDPCETKTSKCYSENGRFNCTCLPGYIPSSYSDRVCVSCPIGYETDDFGICKLCNFGYSGFNCNESWKLTLVIVGSVLGGLLLISIILLPIVAIKSPKKSSKKNKMKENGKSNMSQMSSAPAPMVHGGLAESRPVSAQGGPSNSLAAFANAGVPRIPRATTTSGYDRGSNLEMTPSNSRQNLIHGAKNTRLYDDDDMSGNAYSRPQSNPYAQNRPQFNPYGQSQGQSNPYFASDVGRRY